MISGVVINMEGLKDLAEQVRALHPRGGGGAGDNAFRRMLRQWGVRYLEFVRRRYLRLSRSGGGADWRPLSPLTIAKRRRGRPGSSSVRAPGGGRRFVEGVGQAAILVDTASLFAALNIGAPGSLFQFTEHGTVRVGFGPVPHKDRDGGSSMTFAQLAVIHNFGAKSSINGVPVVIPARPILVAPDRATLDGMLSDAQRAVRRVMEQAARKARGGRGGSGV